MGKGGWNGMWGKVRKVDGWVGMRKMNKQSGWG